MSSFTLSRKILFSWDRVGTGCPLLSTSYHHPFSAPLPCFTSSCPLTLDILSHSCLSSSLCLLLQTALSSRTPTTVLCHSTNRIPLTALSTFLFVPLQFFSLKCSQTDFHTRIHHNTLLKIFNGCLPTTRVKSNSA